MSTVIWVHGTGVRRPDHDATLALIRTQLASVRPDVNVESCLWGDDLGAGLRAGGASIPNYATSRGGEPEIEPDDVQMWLLLYADPLIELRGADPSSAADLPPSHEPPGWEVQDRARHLNTADLDVIEALRRSGLAGEGTLTGEGVLTGAINQVLGEPVWHEAMYDDDLAPGLGLLLARAVVAELVRRTSDLDRVPPPLDGGARDELVIRLAAHFDPLAVTDRSVGGAAGAWTARQVWRVIGARMVERRRGAIHDGTEAMTGDVAVYLARGKAIRRRIDASVKNAPPGPVSLLAHSLGGIAAVDLLALGNGSRVVKLITVGSQAPFLYEIGALPSLAFGQPLPATFPDWLNIYDERDLLSYLAAGVFPGRVRDVAVNSRQPFPWSHSAYWSSADFYRLIAAELP